MESAICFGVGVLLGAVIVLATFVFQRWYESYHFRHEPVGNEGIEGIDQSPEYWGTEVLNEEYFEKSMNYPKDGGHELGEPDMSDEALERYARMAGIDFEGEHDELD